MAVSLTSAPSGEPDGLVLSLDTCSDNLWQGPQVTLVQIDRSGAVTLLRFVSGEETVRLDLSAEEMARLMATYQAYQRAAFERSLSYPGRPID